MSSTAPSPPVVVVEDDPWLRLVAVVLDPDMSQRWMPAYADFMAHDVPDFQGWCDRVRGELGRLWPARVLLVEDEADFIGALARADLALVEGFQVGSRVLAAAPRLRAVQKYGALTRNIDTTACAARGVKVLTIRRRANIACAEHAFALMLGLARQLPAYANRLSPCALAERGHAIRPFDRPTTPNGNWARVPGLSSLMGTRLGVIGMGEIGREIARRARAFDMEVVYTQRTRLDVAEEAALGIAWLGLDDVLATSDWIVPQLPASPATRHLIDAAKLRLVKPTARIVSVSRPDVIEREAVLAALEEGRLGGLGLDPPYASPGAEDDALVRLDNVIVTPHFAGSPRQNGLADLEEMLKNMAKELVS